MTTPAHAWHCDDPETHAAQDCQPLGVTSTEMARAERPALSCTACGTVTRDWAEENDEIVCLPCLAPRDGSEAGA